MLFIRWDALAVVGVVVLLVGYLLVQLLLRFDAAQLFEARRVARRSPSDERNLYDLAADVRSDTRSRHGPKRRKAL